MSTPRRRRKKYYVVSVGKCTGVFDSWHVKRFLSYRSFVLIIYSGLNRPLVQSYTSGVSGSCQKSYSTYEEAFEVYEDLKEKNLLQVLRVPGDEAIFGRIEDSMQ